MRQTKWPAAGDEPRFYGKGGRVEVRWRDGLVIRRRVVRLQRGEWPWGPRPTYRPGSPLHRVLVEARRGAPMPERGAA